MKMKSFRTIYALLLVFMMTAFFAPTLNAQSSGKSKIITEYNGKRYYIHTVVKKQSLKDIAEIYDVTVYEIVNENKDVKKNLKAGTYLRIPYKDSEITDADYEGMIADTTAADTQSEAVGFVEPTFDAERLYKVALMMPLYLEQVDEKFLDDAASNKQLLSKPFSYLHFYEGFMIAADSMVGRFNMKLDLKVYDVDQDMNKAAAVLEDPWLKDADVIIGPFHIKTFEKVMEYAAENDILIINPMTNRDDLVVGNKNVVKVKPSYRYQIHWLEKLVKDKYTDNNVFIFTMDTNNMDYVRMIDSIVSNNVNEYSLVPNKRIKQIVKKHQDAWKIEEVEFDENKYKSDNVTLDVSYINRFPDDSTMLKNQIRYFNYSADSLNGVKKIASSVRNNLFIVYGDNNVFATEMLNKINILSGEYPSELVALPDWSKFDRLFNENLMKLNTVFFDDDYTDYNSFRVGEFICKFREKYGTEPKEMAYHGFNIAWYFLNALMNYGDNINVGITSYSEPLLNTTYRFERRSLHDGAENTYWNIYQYQDYSKKLLEYE